ncbi:MAG: hypothetical protein RLZZ164_125 [Actinomycetota bacterium]
MRRPPSRDGVSTPKRATPAPVKPQAAAQPRPVRQPQGNVSSLIERRQAKARAKTRTMTPSRVARPNARKAPRGKGAGLFGRVRPRLSKEQNSQRIAQIRRFTSASRGRKAVTFTLLGSFVVLLAVVAASVATPMLAVREIRVTGLHSIDQKKILNAVKDQKGVPLALVSQDHIASELASFTRIESFSLISELPNTLHISIKERSPIAIVVVAGVAYLYDPAGIQLDVATYKDMYPLISANGDPSKSASFQEAIDVLLALPAELLPQVASINATSKDNVTLQLRGYAGQKIIWGDASQSILKSRTLSALIANQKQTDRVTYDVSSPSAPVVRWR